MEGISNLKETIEMLSDKVDQSESKIQELTKELEDLSTKQQVQQEQLGKKLEDEESSQQSLPVNIDRYISTAIYFSHIFLPCQGLQQPERRTQRLYRIPAFRDGRPSQQRQDARVPSRPGRHPSADRQSRIQIRKIGASHGHYVEGIQT